MAYLGRERCGYGVSEILSVGCNQHEEFCCSNVPLTKWPNLHRHLLIVRLALPTEAFLYGPLRDSVTVFELFHLSGKDGVELYELTRGEADELAEANGMFREVCHLDGCTMLGSGVEGACVCTMCFKSEFSFLPGELTDFSSSPKNVEAIFRNC